MGLILIVTVGALLRFFDVETITALWVLLGCVSVGMLVDGYLSRRRVRMNEK